MFTVIVDTPGGRARELTPIADSVVFDTQAVGGFGSASFSFQGDKRRILPPLSTVRIMYGSSVAWEGRLEDPEITIDEGGCTTSATAFGWNRILSDVSVRRVWSLRQIDWQEQLVPKGQDLRGTPNTLIGAGGGLSSVVGQYDPADLTKLGVRVSGVSVRNDLPTASWAGVEAYSLTGLLFTRILFTYAGTGIDAVLQTSSDGVTYTMQFQNAPAATVYDSGAVSLTNVRIGGLVHNGGDTVSPATTADFYDVRLLGAGLAEDASGGFYGDTILRDLIALCPGLYSGLIEVGSDFTIPEIERRTRSLIDAVVTEVAGYYSREWAVWENGRFDWTTPKLDEAQWIVPLAQITRLNIKASVDTTASEVYVLFTNAFDQATAEAVTAATDRRNPFVRNGTTKDSLVDAPASMTPNTASQFSALQAAEQTYTPVTGSVTMPASALIANGAGHLTPAALIRAGHNVSLPELPKSEPLRQQRDGETLFHVVSTEVDMGAGTITFQLEGQSSRMSMISARLAAATRVVTG